jgi:hypothetical protein
VELGGDGDTYLLAHCTWCRGRIETGRFERCGCTKINLLCKHSHYIYFLTRCNAWADYLVKIK